MGGKFRKILNILLDKEENLQNVQFKTKLSMADEKEIQIIDDVSQSLVDEFLDDNAIEALD